MTKNGKNYNQRKLRNECSYGPIYIQPHRSYVPPKPFVNERRRAPEQAFPPLQPVEHPQPQPQPEPEPEPQFTPLPPGPVFGDYLGPLFHRLALTEVAVENEDEGTVESDGINHNVLENADANIEEGPEVPVEALDSIPPPQPIADADECSDDGI